MKRRMLIFAGLVLALVFLSGCLPFDSADVSTIYEIKANKNIKSSQVYTGELSASAETWEPGNCTEKITLIYDQLISFIQLGMTMDPNTTDANRANAENAIAALNALKETTTCTFQKHNGTGTLTMSYEFSKQLLDDLGAAGTTTGSTIEIEILSDGTIKAVIPIEENVGGTTGLPGGTYTQTEIKVKVEGTLQELTPSGYVEEEGYYVYKDLTPLYGNNITVKFTPSAGIALPFGDLLVPIAVVVIVVLIIIVIIMMKMAKGGPKPFPTAVPPAPPTSQ